MLTVSETAALLQTFDNILILTHVRPDSDTVGCAAALCAGLRALGKIAVKEVSRTGRCRERIVIHLQHTGLGLSRQRCHTFIFAVDQIINDFFTVLVKGSVFLYGVPFGSRRTVSHRLTSDQLIGRNFNKVTKTCELVAIGTTDAFFPIIYHSARTLAERN